MTKQLTVALATSMLLLLSCVFPANAGPLYSFTGTVGDEDWFPADPTIVGPGSLEFFRDLSSVFQVNGGPGGFITIDFSGPAVLAERDKEAYSFSTITATCTNLSGCYTCTDIFGCSTPDFSYDAGGGGDLEPCCVTYPIDSTFYHKEVETPPFAPYGATFTGYDEGYVGFLFDVIVGPDAVGQPFSLTVNQVPEPPAWTLMLAGLAGIGFLIRRTRPRSI